MYDIHMKIIIHSSYFIETLEQLGTLPFCKCKREVLFKTIGRNTSHALGVVLIILQLLINSAPLI